MLNTGDSTHKHGGAQAATVTAHQLLSAASSKSTQPLQIVGCFANVNIPRPTSAVLHVSDGHFATSNGGVVVVPGVNNSSSTTTSTDLHLSHSNTPACRLVGSSSARDQHSVDEEEAEAVSSQDLGWLKHETEDLDLLQAEEATKPLSSSSLMDTSSDFSDRVNDFAFASSIPDTSIMKQNVGIGYFETLENADYTTGVGTAHISWGSGEGTGGQDTPLSGNAEAFVSFSDGLVEEVNSAGAISCGAGDLNSMLFEGMGHDMKAEALPVEIMQYTDSLNFTVGGKNVMCSDDLPNNFNTMSSSSNLKSLPLTFASTMVDQVALPNLHDSSSDLNLTSLPNFLGLESASTDVSGSGHFIEGSSVNILGENAVSLDSQTVTGAVSLPEHILHSIDSAQLNNQKITVTTISISNDEENSTKILVDSHQGQQQMYVINTANMNKSHNGNVHQGNMFVINASDLTPASSGTFSISALDSNVENLALASQPITSQPSLTASAIPGKQVDEHNLLFED